ncbi:MAG: hypothetical protein C0399_05695 [Syntrophus sp. (in: bacteria)]|nr:hypothetical protein [Syntrophus sp. (in: bacteria)]
MKKIILIATLVLIGMISVGNAEEPLRILDKDQKVSRYVKEDRIYDADWRLKGTIKGDRIYDAEWNHILTIKKGDK